MNGGPRQTSEVLKTSEVSLEAAAWDPEAEIMLERIGVSPGWNCLDMRCGPEGMLGALSRRVGPQGRVLGLAADANDVAAARAFAQENNLKNVEIFTMESFDADRARPSFDLTHARFTLASAGRDADLLQQMIALTRPGGVIAVEEPDTSAWTFYPPHPAWEKLKTAILAAIARSGGDFNAGRRAFDRLRRAGLQDVQIRAAVIALQDQHPYKLAPVQLAALLRPRILETGLLGEAELDQSIADCERIAHDSGTVGMSFIVNQVWGRRPGSG